ncbi:30S ribosomal protein S10 [Candidatus Woesearchaeota archaeon]|nr:30S ribosomal protein S10 [Candidatus Woesearchaeota archaeon]
MIMSKARINLAGAEIYQVNDICNSIVEIAKKTKTKFYGPIPLPTTRMKVTTRKSPCGDGKASFDRFEMRIHKRVIDLEVDERALRLVMKVPIPDGIQISINVLG